MIVWSGPFGDLSGYATAARDYVEAFHYAGIDVKCHHVNYDRRKDNGPLIDQNLLRLVCDLEVSNLADSSISTFVCHATPNASYLVPPVKTNINYSVWETSHIPAEFVPALERFNFILTASEFSRSAFLSSGPNLDVKVLPHVINDNTKHKLKVSQQLLDKIAGKFVFLWNSEWIIGKGYDILLKSFCRAFEGNPDVILLLKTYNLSESSYTDKVSSYIKSIKKTSDPQIVLLSGNMKCDDVLSLYSVADVFLNTSRREAWSLTSSEAFSFKVPVIAPDKGGHTQFLNESNSLLVESDWTPVRDLERNRQLYQGQDWIEMNEDAFIEALRSSLSLKINEKAWQATMNEFSPEEISKKFLTLTE